MNLWNREEDRVAVAQELSEKGKVHGREFQFRKRSGEILTGLFSREIISIDGERYVLSSIGDITERKWAEEERVQLIVQLQKALAEVKTLKGIFQQTGNQE